MLVDNLQVKGFTKRVLVSGFKMAFSYLSIYKDDKKLKSTSWEWG